MSERSLPGANFYAGLSLDRAAERRRDEAWLRQQLQDPATRFVPVWRGRSLIRAGDSPAAGWLGAGEIGALLEPDSWSPLLLCVEEGAACFAVDLSGLDEETVTARTDPHGRFVDLRSVGPVLDRRDGSLLAYARGLVYWHGRQRFCGVCGAPTVSASAGHSRVCADASCAAEHFPRTDPAIIVLVTQGERCLLGRQRQWPAGMHSTLAGFVETGESLEEAVVREVREEVGIELSSVTYHSSQPWPFPASLMLGFTAVAASSAITVDPHELEVAHWYDREILRHSPESDEFRLPRRDSIARRLIQDWLAGSNAAAA